MQLNHKNLDQVLTFSCKQVHALHCSATTMSTAVRCTGLVESIVSSIFLASLEAKSKSITFPSKRRRQKVNVLTSRNLQMGIHVNDDLRMMCDSIPSLSGIVTLFMDQEMEELFAQEGRVLTKKPATVAVPSGSQSVNLPSLSQWRRQDDAVTDSDFARLLMRTHPAYTLSNDARLFLGSMTRELIIETLRARTSSTESAGNSLLVGGAVGERARRYGSVVLDRFSLIQPKGERVRLIFQALDSTVTTATCRMKASRDAPISDVLDKACSKLKVQRKNTTFVYFGRPLDSSATPGKIGMDSSACPIQIFAVPKKWWIFKQREQARKGLLTSVKSIDVKELLDQVRSKVDNANNIMSKKSSSKNRRKRGSKRSSSTSHLPQSSSKSDEDPRFLTKLRKPQSYKKSPSSSSSSSSSSISPSKSFSSMPRLIRSPKTGSRPDLSELDNIPVPQIEAFTDAAHRSSRKSPFRPVRHKRSKKKSSEPGAKLRAEKRKELRRKGAAEAAKAKQRRKIQQEHRKKQAIVKIQSKIRQVQGKRIVQHKRNQKEKQKEKQRLDLKKDRRKKFNAVGKISIKESKRTLKAWERVRRVFQDLPRWIENLEVPGGDDDDEGLLALEHARKLRALLFDAETQTEHFQETARSTLEMLEKWSSLAIAEEEEPVLYKHEAIRHHEEVPQVKIRLPSEIYKKGSFGSIHDAPQDDQNEDQDEQQLQQQEEEEEEQEEKEFLLPSVTRSRERRRNLKIPLTVTEEE